jgi:hypothetical protein
VGVLAEVALLESSVLFSVQGVISAWRLGGQMVAYLGSVVREWNGYGTLRIACNCLLHQYVGQPCFVIQVLYCICLQARFRSSQIYVNNVLGRITRGNPIRGSPDTYFLADFLIRQGPALTFFLVFDLPREENTANQTS